jgi:hypothetical protein
LKPEEKVTDQWIPTYQTKAGQNVVMVEIPDIRCVECPVSLLDRHPESSDMVYQIHVASLVKESTGAMLYGNDTAKWPEKWHEAVVIAERERRKVEWEQDEAVKKMTG